MARPQSHQKHTDTKDLHGVHESPLLTQLHIVATFHKPGITMGDIDRLLRGRVLCDLSETSRRPFQLTAELDRLFILIDPSIAPVQVGDHHTTFMAIHAHVAALL